MLESIWREDGEYLTKKSERFEARSTGCSCCSVKLDSEEEVKIEAIKSLSEVILASRYFGWDFTKLVKEANQQEKLKKFKMRSSSSKQRL